MDGHQFDALVHTALTSRRSVLGLLGVLGGVMADDAAAGNGKHKKGKRKKKGGKKSTTPGPTAPVATPDARCAATGSGTFAARVGQTFRALRSGQLTSASVFILQNTQVNAFDIEIWSVDPSNTPSAVLAGTTIANVPAVAFTDPVRRLTATFAGHATVSAGLRYALVITQPSGNVFTLESAIPGSCPDGGYFYSLSPTGAFVESPGVDVHFETVVTA